MKRHRHLDHGLRTSRAQPRRVTSVAVSAARQPQPVKRAVRSTVIVPVFNHAALTRQCLEALLRTVGPDVEIVVVDDGSTDHTPVLLAEFAGRVRAVTHPRNAGFAASCNDGAAAAKAGEFVVFLNNDTIPHPGWLDALEEYAADHPRAAVVGAKLLYPSNTIQHAGVVICQDRYPRHIYSGFPADHPAVSKSRRFQLVTAAAMLVRRKVFRAEGGFDVRFRNGFEDVDFCLRLGERGHEIHYCAESVVQHFESVSPGRFERDKENVSLYRERWLSRVQPDDLVYYAQDGLLSLNYEGTFPLNLRVSPLLATLDSARVQDAEQVLAHQARQVADLTRENTKLRAELGLNAGRSAALEYDQLRARLRAMVDSTLPPEARVLVISKGDGALLQLDGRDARHFPQSPTGGYAGYHPADGGQAVAMLKRLLPEADHLLIPETSRWWLEHYRAFSRFLRQRCRLLARRAGVGEIYSLPKPDSGCAGHA